MISDTLLDKLNSQMNYEFYSSHVYLAQAGYCSSLNLNGFANFFLVQAEEERDHGMRIYKYLTRVGKRAIVSAMLAPENEYSSALDVFEQAHEHEKTVTRRIYELSDLAVSEREHATVHFLKWFIDEQIEEESLFEDIVHKVKLVSDGTGLYMLDAELAKRTFVPAANSNE